MNITPLNTDVDGCASCIKANYYKMGGANFIGHTNDGFRATCILEIMDKRLNQLLNSGVEITDTCMLDTYNQQVQKDTSCTIRTNINTANHHFIAEVKSDEPICLNSKVDGKQPSLADRIYDTHGIATCVTTGFHPNIAEPQVLTPKRTDFGKQVRKQYESGELNMSRHDMTELEPRKDGVCNTLTSVQKDNLVAEPLRIPQATEQGYVEVPVGGVFDGSYLSSKTRRGRVQEGGTIAPTLMAGGEGLNLYEGITNYNHEESELFERQDEGDTGKILRLLQQEVREETYKWAVGRLRSILKEEILQSGVHEESICKTREHESELFSSTPHITEDNLSDSGKVYNMRNMRLDKEHRCTPQGWEFSEQFAIEFNDIVQKLSHENPSTQTIMSNLWQSCKGTRFLQQTLYEVEKIWQPINDKPQSGYRIRKLTPREVFRLMGVSESDIDKIQQSGISNSQQYKMAGNSIVVDVLYYIFKNMILEEDNSKTDEHGQLSLF